VGANAAAYEVDGEFVVVRRSTARREGSASWDSYITLRDSLVKDAKLVVKDDALYEFTSDVEFSSPSAAALLSRHPTATAARPGIWRMGGLTPSGNKPSLMPRRR